MEGGKVILDKIKSLEMGDSPVVDAITHTVLFGSIWAIILIVTVYTLQVEFPVSLFITCIVVNFCAFYLAGTSYKRIFEGDPNAFRASKMTPEEKEILDSMKLPEDMTKIRD